MEQGLHRDQFDKLHWPSRARILQIEIYEVVWKEPKEELEPYDDYVLKYGDPEQNERGDKEIRGPGGQRFIKHKQSQNLWTRQKILRQQAQREYDIPQGDDSFSNQFMDDRYEAMKRNLGRDKGSKKSASARALKEAEEDEAIGDDDKKKKKGEGGAREAWVR